MGPAVKSPAHLNPIVKPTAEDEEHVRAGVDEAERGEAVDLTPEERRHWAETGKWPERLD